MKVTQDWITLGVQAESKRVWFVAKELRNGYQNSRKQGLREGISTKWFQWKYYLLHSKDFFDCWVWHHSSRKEKSLDWHLISEHTIFLGTNMESPRNCHLENSLDIGVESGDWFLLFTKEKKTSTKINGCLYAMFLSLGWNNVSQQWQDSKLIIPARYDTQGNPKVHISCLETTNF